MDMELTNANEFILPPVHHELLRRIPCYSIPWEWNSTWCNKAATLL
jgi:hypothetical protein